MNSSRQERDVRGGLESFDIVIIGASGGIGQYLIKVFGGANKIIGTYCSDKPDTLNKGACYYKVNLLKSDIGFGFLFHYCLSSPAPCFNIQPRHIAKLPGS